MLCTGGTRRWLPCVSALQSAEVLAGYSGHADISFFVVIVIVIVVCACSLLCGYCTVVGPLDSGLHAGCAMDDRSLTILMDAC